MRIVPACSRGLAILEFVASRTEPVKVSEIASALGLPRSATYELVHTLVAHQMLESRADGRFSLGLQVFALGQAYLSSVDVVREANEVAHGVMLRCNETVQVGQLDGRHVLYVAKVESTRTVRLVSSVGRRLPAHCTALGKMMLSLLSPEELETRLGGVELEALTPQSVTDCDRLRREFGLTAKRGWAMEVGESNPDAGCVAAPVWDASGDNVLALSISVPASRFDADRRAELREIVVEGAALLSRRLGHNALENVADGAS